jgi:hypothetical protein
VGQRMLKECPKMSKDDTCMYMSCKKMLKECSKNAQRLLKDCSKIIHTK